MSRWTYVHSLLFLLLGASMLFMRGDGAGKWITLAAAATAAGSFTVLLLIHGKAAFSVPNSVSMIRVVLVIATTPILFSGRQYCYAVFLLLVLAGFSDFFDGVVARRLGTTAFGAKLDMELDAFFIFMLAAFAYVYYGQARWVLTAGLLRYGYVFLLHLLPGDVGFPRFILFLSKGGCALAEIALIVVSAPILGDQTRMQLCLFAVIVLCASFVLDLVLRLSLKGRKIPDTE